MTRPGILPSISINVDFCRFVVTFGVIAQEPERRRVLRLVGLSRIERARVASFQGWAMGMLGYNDVKKLRNGSISNKTKQRELHCGLSDLSEDIPASSTTHEGREAIELSASRRGQQGHV